MFVGAVCWCLCVRLIGVKKAKEEAYMEVSVSSQETCDLSKDLVCLDAPLSQDIIKT